MVKKIISLILFVFLLTGCQDDISAYNYYMHPYRLKTKIQHCQAASDTQSSSCVAAIAAATELTANSRAYVEDQEAYGQRILKAQMTLANKQKELKRLKTQLQTSPDDKTLQEKVTNVQTIVKGEEQDINKLQFIVGFYVRF